MTILDWLIFILSALIFAASVLTVLHHVFFGLEKTNLNDRYIWGLNIQGFFVLSSLGCGILAVISAFVIFGIDYPAAIFELAGAVAFSCFLSAMMLMGADLGRPFRVFKIITGKNPASPLTLDFICVLLLTLLSFIFMFGIFMGVREILHLWAYATLFFVVLCLLAHVMLFILNKSSDPRIKSFEGLATVSCSLWAGVAAVTLLTLFTGYRDLLLGALLAMTIIVFATQVAGLLSALLAGQKPHTFIVTGISFFVFAFLAVRGTLIESSPWPVDAAICVLVIVALFIEKFSMVISFQKVPVLPHPYSMYDKVKPYRPSFSEVGNLIAGLSLVIVATYAIIIVREYILPFIVGLFR